MKNLKRISPELHRRLFGRPQPEAPFSIQKAVERELAEFGLADVEDPTAPGELPLPDWFPTSTEFFAEAAEAYLAPYKHLLQYLTAYSGQTHNITTYNTPVGRWAKWDNGVWRPIKLPPSHSAYCLDFETVEVAEGEAWLPSCCVALRVLDGHTELYVWRQDFYNPFTVVPFSGGNLITGWNVAAYDRMYLATEYGLSWQGNVFFDLMAGHIKNRGICNQQLTLLTIAEGARESGQEDGEYIPAWTYDTSSNGLAAAYRLYTGGTVDKGVRDQIVELGLPWVESHMSEVIEYCILDVYKTLELWEHIYPEYSGYPDIEAMANSRNTSPVSLAGHLMSSTSHVPLSPELWEGYYKRAEGTYQSKLVDIEQNLRQRSKRLLDQYGGVLSELYNMYSLLKSVERVKPGSPLRVKREKAVQELGLEGYTPESLMGYFTQHLDPWAAQLDWAPITPKGSDIKRPKWYHYMLADGVSIGKRLTPLLLKMQWMGEPVRYDDERGWHTDAQQVPHPEEPDKPCSALFAKGMKTVLDNGQLSSADENLSPILQVVTSTVIWKSMRKRIKLMKVEWVDGVPWFVPDALPHGTISGRQASKTLHVFSHAKPADPSKGKLAATGSGFMTLIQSLPGREIETIDFDSQELKLFALAGCETYGYIGSTPLSMMVEVGQPSKGTDFHSQTMKATGITNRTLVKNCNYAGCYNVGQATQVKTILKGNPELGTEKATELESKWRRTFQGVRIGKGRFAGGSASESFNVLMRRANAKRLYTLFGGCELSRAISGNPDFMTTRFNAVIQATGAVMLDHILVGTWYIAKREGIDTRYMFSRHDEWAFHTAEADRMRMAWAMQVVHCAVWAELIQQMGLDTLTLNLAYASSVQVSQNYLKSIDAVVATDDMPVHTPIGFALTKQDILNAL